MGDPAFWNDAEKAREVIAEANTVKAWTEPWTRLSGKVQDLTELGELLAVEEDAELAEEWEREVEAVGSGLEDLELRNMLQGPDDTRDALLTIHPGAGGTESQDWAEMLLRMYGRWGERRGFEVELLDQQEGDEAGIKSATLEIRGQYAYGYLRAERGVHRLVRISPFDSQARRHTSFASVFVYPVVDDTIEIEIREEDIEMDVYRASGAGGQHVNKTESAVRITHLPTGLVVSCQDEKSQHKNKDRALGVLRSRLLDLRIAEQEAERARDRKLQVGTGDRSAKIRTYNFPQSRVTDHRIGYTTHALQQVLDGGLDEMIHRLKLASQDEREHAA